MKSPPRRITLKVFRTAREAEPADRDFWTSLTLEERLVEAWRLSEEQWSLHGKLADEP
jgi:hypothetical protein